MILAAGFMGAFVAAVIIHTFPQAIKEIKTWMHEWTA